jgi:hypothetical protein
MNANDEKETEPLSTARVLRFVIAFDFELVDPDRKLDRTEGGPGFGDQERNGTGHSR